MPIFHEGVVERKNNIVQNAHGVKGDLKSYKKVES